MKFKQKSMIYIVVLSIILSFIFNSTFLTYAATTSNTDDFSAAIISYIEETKSGDDSISENVQIDDFIPLLNDEDEIIGRCYFLKPAGYIIIQNNFVVSEAAFTNTKTVQILKSRKNNKVYYGGPLLYYTESDNSYIDLLNEIPISKSQAIATIRNAQNITNTAVRSSTTFSVHPTTYSANTTSIITIYGSLRSGWDYNPDGRCGATAAAITLAYFADYIDSWVVPSWHMTSNGQSLTELLTPWIHDTPGEGAIAEEVVYGFNTYFRWRGISDEYTAFFSSKSALNSNLIEYICNVVTPVVVMINSHPIYKNHFVVAHGIKTDSGINNVLEVIVNDGWGSNGVYINISYCVAAAIMKAI